MDELNLGHNEAGCLIINNYLVGLSGGKFATQVNILFKVTIDLSTDGSFRALISYFDINGIATLLYREAMKSSTAIGQPSLNVHQYLHRIGLGKTHHHFMDRRRKYLQLLFVLAAGSQYRYG